MAKTRLTPLVKTPIIVQQPASNWPIPDQFVGLEIEFERFSQREVDTLIRQNPQYWELKTDGSLRNGIEAVLTQPTMGTGLTEAIDQFFSIVKTYEVSPRTSIHVHLNMRQESDTLESLRNIAVLYFMYEDAFFRISDESRKWCSYCNAFEDNPPDPLVALFRGQDLNDVIGIMLDTNTNAQRYYGLNLYALHRYGTLEFRHFPCVTDKERLLEWLRLLMELKKAATIMADRDLSVFDIFSDPTRIPELGVYMPEFGEKLRAIVSDEDAYDRLCRAATYRAGTKEGKFGYRDHHKQLFRFFNKIYPELVPNPDKQGTAEGGNTPIRGMAHEFLVADHEAGDPGPEPQGWAADGPEPATGAGVIADVVERTRVRLMEETRRREMDFLRTATRTIPGVPGRPTRRTR